MPPSAPWQSADMRREAMTRERIVALPDSARRGLAWADGLVEIGDGARQIAPGDPVRYIPYSSFR